jgi:glucosamine-6-phosphate deaminase
MDIIIVKDAEQAGQRAADIIESTIWQKLDAVLGFATGSSPLPVYQAHGQRGLDFSGASGFALDEYVDIPLEHPQRYAVIIRREVVDLLALNEQLVHVPDGRALDLDRSAQQ